MVRKANCLFASFPRVGLYKLTRLFQFYRLSLYGSGLWSLSSPALQNVEVAFNKILCRIWSLPPCSHFCIVLIFTASSMSSIPVLILSSLLPPTALLCLLVPSPMIPLFSVSLSVGIIPCLAVVTSSNITLKTHLCCSD